MIKINRNIGPWPITMCSICDYRLLSVKGYYEHINEKHGLPKLKGDVDLDLIDCQLSWLNLK